MLTLIKLGGSLITDKNQRKTYHSQIVSQIGKEIQNALRVNPKLQIIIGHGSGSFGHFEAKEHDTIHGVHTREEWEGFAKVANVAAELNMLVADTLEELGLPVLRIQTSASSLAHDGELVDLALQNISKTLEHDLIPLIYGDVAFDEVRGGTILSTETIFKYLCTVLPIERIFLAGNVDGVYDHNKQLIPQITPATWGEIKPSLGTSSGVDVTGGMLTKVEDMLSLVRQNKGLKVYILNGEKIGIMENALLDNAVTGTTISS